MANANFKIINDDCLVALAAMEENSIAAIVTDPPYELGFMGRAWDKSGIAYNVELWRLALRVLKPGGHLLAFGGTRTYHRMACAIEDAGFDVRDMMQWLYGSGFPKSHNVSKAIDKAAGAEREVIGMQKLTGTARGHAAARTTAADGYEIVRSEMAITAPATPEAKQWDGWGSALKPANEPICLARKPFDGTISDNVLRWGTGGLNIDGCRVEGEELEVRVRKGGSEFGQNSGWNSHNNRDTVYDGTAGRFPANIMHDGSDEATAGMGEAARFFYCAKAGHKERDAGLDALPPKARPTMGSGIGGQPDQSLANNRNSHPTVKPIALMRYLVRLVTPPGGVVLDMFMGSGTTGCAAMLEGFDFIGTEREPEFAEIARLRIEYWREQAALQSQQLTIFDKA